MKAGRWRFLFQARLLSPKGLLVRAVSLVVAYAIAHAFGLREYTSIFSGTSPPSGWRDTVSVGLGVAYVTFYLGFVLVAPVLALAAALFAALHLGLLERRAALCPDGRASKARTRPPGPCGRP